MDSNMIEYSPNTTPQIINMYEVFGIKQVIRFKNRSYLMTDDTHAVTVLNTRFPGDDRILNHFNRIATNVNFLLRNQPYYLFIFRDESHMWCTEDEFWTINKILETGKGEVSLWYSGIEEGKPQLTALYN